MKNSFLFSEQSRFFLIKLKKSPIPLDFFFSKGENISGE